MDRFNIIVVSEGSNSPVFCVNSDRDHSERPGVWIGLAAAEAWVAGMSPDYSRATYTIVPEGKGITWQCRELSRFAAGTYRETPWHNEPWYQAKHNEHFCHVSTEQEGKIAFTENAKKGEADRQLVMSPGRYLNRFFSDVLDNCAIEQWCAKLSVALQEDALKVTQDADEIEEVYVGGPSSCMAYDVSHFSGHCHPSRVYAGPDLAIAYIGSREDAKARAVVWPENKRYGRIYGDVSRLKLLLEQAGYVSGSMRGARIQRIENERGPGFIMPYVDNGGDAADEGEYLRLGHGCIEVQNQHGVSDRGWECPRCEDVEDEDESTYIEDVGERWCSHCTSNHATRCEYSDEYYSDSRNTFHEVHRSTYTDTIHEDNLSAYGAVYVEDRDEYWHEDYVTWCDHYERHFVTADGVFQFDGKTLCEDAYDGLKAEADAAAEDDDDSEHLVLAA